jgi:hypothetical protein
MNAALSTLWNLGCGIVAFGAWVAGGTLRAALGAAIIYVGLSILLGVALGNVQNQKASGS